MNKETRQRIGYVVCDWVMSSVALLCFNIARYYLLLRWEVYDSLEEFLLDPKLVLEEVAIPLMCLFVFWLSGFYNSVFMKSRLQELITTFFSSIVNTSLIFLALLTNDLGALRSTNYALIFILFGFLFVFTYIGRLLLTSHALKMARTGRWTYPTLIIGASDTAAKLAADLYKSQSQKGVDIIGHVELPGETTDASISTDTYQMDHIEDVCNRHKVRQLILVPHNYDDNKMLVLLGQLLHLNRPIKIAPDTLSFITSGIHLQDIFGVALVDLTAPSGGDATKNIKRTIDVAFSSIALLLLALPMAAVALAVKMTSKGPVIYRQERIGYKQKPFKIYKFRSMRQDAEKDGPRLSSSDDPRITTFGHFMRKYRIDELPQFFNVLKGDMSIVGPRPERQYFIDGILQKAPWYLLVQQVRPGITSWGMVKYGYATTIDEMVKRARFDLVYLSNLSIAVDFKIMIYTLRTILTGKGI